MAQVRFFAQARDATGCREVVIDAATVGDIVDEVIRRYGPQLEAVIATSTIWLNGDPVAPGHPATAADEVAILPPVSGG